MLFSWCGDKVEGMSTKAQAILEEIRALPPPELRELWQQISRMVLDAGEIPPPVAQASDDEFEAALAEVTGATAGRGSLQQLLEDRRQDRERDEAWLAARKRERTRG